MKAHDNYISCFCLSNSKLIASGQLADPRNPNYDSPVLLWKFKDPQSIIKFMGLKHGVKQLMFSHDGRYLAGVSNK